MDAGERVPAEQARREARVQVAPRAHVLGLLLDPDDGDVARVRREGGLEVRVLEGVVLLEPHALGGEGGEARRLFYTLHFYSWV